MKNRIREAIYVTRYGFHFCRKWRRQPTRLETLIVSNFGSGYVSRDPKTRYAQFEHFMDSCLESIMEES